MTFAQRIIQLRKLHHLSQHEVNLYGGPSVSRQVRIEKGADPSYPELWEYCAAFNMSVWHLMDDVEQV